MSGSTKIDLELIPGDEDPERGLEAVARFLVGLWEACEAARTRQSPLDSANKECHPEDRFDRERQLPIEPNQSQT
jgi:hypothetical protein